MLTRAGEFTLDLIEGIQEHPALAASLLAAGFGAVVGLVVAALVPRRPSAAELAARAAAEAAESAAELGLPGRLTFAQRRLGETLGSASAGLRGRGVLGDGVVARLRRGAQEAEVAEQAASAAGGRAGLLGETGSVAWRRAQAARQLIPIAVALLRNDIIRELVAHAIAGRLRRRVHL